MLIGATFRDVYNMGLRGPIGDPKGNRNSSIWSLSQKVFTGFTSVLLHMLIASILLDGCGIWASEAQILGLEMNQNSVVVFFFFLLFCEKVSIGFTSILLDMFIGAIFKDVYNMGLKGPSENSGLWSLSQKVFNGFTSVLLHVVSASNVRCLENMGLRGPIFGTLWAPK